MPTKDHPDHAVQPELDFRGAASKVRKHRKELKRRVARAARIEKEGLGPRDVACPHCGAPPFVSVKRDPGYCRTFPKDGGDWNPLPRHENHKKRVEAAAHLKKEILRQGGEARRELLSAGP